MASSAWAFSRSKDTVSSFFHDSGSDDRSSGPSQASGGDAVSFEDFFEEEARKEFGDLGPADTGARQGGGRGESGPRRNPRRGGRR